MTIIQTIKLVLKNGYKHQVFNLETMIKDDMLDPDTVNSILLDRNFWIVLSKGLNQQNDFTKPSWRSYWYRFIDHLAEGKSLESFFESLENQK